MARATKKEEPKPEITEEASNAEQSSPQKAEKEHTPAPIDQWTTEPEASAVPMSNNEPNMFESAGGDAPDSGKDQEDRRGDFDRSRGYDRPRYREERPRYDRPRDSYGRRDDRPREDYVRRDDYGRRDDRPRDDYGRRDDRPRDDYGRRDDRPRDDYMRRDDRPRDDYGRRDDRPRDDYGRRDDRPRYDRPRDDYDRRSDDRFGGRYDGYRNDRFGPRDDYEPRKRQRPQLREDPVEPNETVGVFNLSYNLTPSDFDEYLKDKLVDFIGKYTTKLVLGAFTNRCRGYGFIHFDDIEDAVKAKKILENGEIHGQQYRVAYSVQRQRHNNAPADYREEVRPDGPREEEN